MSPVEARHDLAKRNTKGDQRMRATGDDATILEVLGSEICGAWHLNDIAKRSGSDLRGLGFKTLRCMYSNVELSLSPPRPVPPPEQVANTTAGQMAADYQESKVAADAKYLNKRLRVTAVVVRVQGGAVELLVLDDYKFMAEFRPDPALSKLRLSDEISMECTGEQVNGMPTLSDCVLDAVSPAAPARGSIDERNALVMKLRRMGFAVRATGDDQATLELASKSEGCKINDLTSTVKSSGYSMYYAGFSKLRCLGNDVSVDLVDDLGAPASVVGLTAGKLFADYSENEISADAKYKGKRLLVSGKVSRIGKDAIGSPFIDLATENQFMGVVARFRSGGPLVALKRGQRVTVRCRGAGLIAGSPILDACGLE